MITAITVGAFDLFHIGHVNLLRNAKKNCDRLIVGISSTNRVLKYKGKKPIISDADRIEIIRSCKYVDDVFLNNGDPKNINSYIKWVKKWNAKKWFVGNDWIGTSKWNEIGIELKKCNCELIYLPYTKRISTSEIILKIIKNNDR